MEEFLKMLYNNQNIKALIVFIVFDVIFGVLRALKEKKINSCIGIDGIIRKVGMILTIIICIVIDKMINIDLIAFVPTEVKNYINIDKVGLAFLFNILYIVFEMLSVFKNMIKCKLPLPKKLKSLLEKILKEFTSEMKEE